MRRNGKTRLVCMQRLEIKGSAEIAEDVDEA